MTLDPKVLAAEQKVAEKRAQLMSSVNYSVEETKRRFAPDLLAGQAWEKTKAKVADTAQDTLDAAKRNPWLVGGIGAAIGLFLARGAIGDLLRDGIDKVRDRIEGDEAEAPLAVEQAPETPVAMAKEAKKRKAGAAKRKTPRKTKTEDVK